MTEKNDTYQSVKRNKDMKQKENKNKMVDNDHQVEGLQECSATRHVEDLQELNATDLNFGKGFENADALSLSEVKILLEHRQAEREMNGQEAVKDYNSMFLDYCTAFSKGHKRPTIMAIRTTLKCFPLHQCEVVALTDLHPSTADEALALIPSLRGRFEEEELQDLLDNINSYSDPYQY